MHTKTHILANCPRAPSPRWRVERDLSERRPDDDKSVDRIAIEEPYPRPKKCNNYSFLFLRTWVSKHRSRHRRQGARLHLPASYVLPGGEGYGAWGPWGEPSACSRTCGGGVATQKRICLQVESDGRSRCAGGDTKYYSCNTQDCPPGSLDFRSQQCAEFDSKPFRGTYYHWVPYTKGPKPCELNCMPHAERFYYRHNEKVVDGTRCNDDSFDVCVDGVCQPVGCDMMLGSNAQEDKCRECRGNGTNCHTIDGVIDTQDLRQGGVALPLLMVPRSVLRHERGR
ncbi:Papilin [Eumeta japonica]|uniref:Papilin n=1 Tax=Eumeta variegata TaxID=151549 RepID=A0A4C1X5B7_EUMVA|nr:Papilin [Eumeta japonica]